MSLERPARRFLHVCYCCSDLDTVTASLVGGLGLQRTMGTPIESQSGAILGIDRATTSGADFVYDARGPRTSQRSRCRVGLTLRSSDAHTTIRQRAASRPWGSPCRRPGRWLSSSSATDAASWDRGRRPVVVSGTHSATVRALSSTSSPIRPLRSERAGCGTSGSTVTDLSSSLPWYQGMGFDIVDQGSFRDASFLGVSGGSSAVFARLRLPDEPYEALLVEWLKPRSHGRHYSEPNHAGLFRAALGVHDTRASYEAMCAEGWVFDRSPMSVALTGTPVPDMWICFLSDPDGVPYELVERPRSSFRP